MSPRKRRGGRNKQAADQAENLLDDVAESPQIPVVGSFSSKHKFIPWLPKIYWFFYRKPIYFLTFVPSFISGWISVWTDISLAKILDGIHKENGLSIVKKYAFLHFLAAIANALLGWVSAHSHSTVNALIRMKIKRVLFKSMLMQDIGFFDDHTFGDLDNLLTEEVGRAQSIFSTGKISQIRVFGNIISSFIVCFSIEWRLSLFSIFSVVMFAMMMKLFRESGRNYFKAAREANSRSVTIADEVISNARIVSSFNRQKVEIERYSDECDLNCDKRGSADILFQSSFCLSSLLDRGALCVCLNIGSYLVLKGDMTPGILFAVSRMAFSLGHQISSYINMFSWEQRSLDSANKIFEIIDMVPTVPFNGGRDIPGFSGKIEFRDVWFKYPTRNVWVLKNVSFTIQPGEITAFVGHSGSGKSTILQLILRFYDISSGSILLDGVDIKDLDPRWIHQVISVVQQDPLLFAMSVRDNVTYGLENSCSDDAVDRALDIAQAANFVSKLPEKTLTQVGEKGTLLSGGQKQRIAIARAVMRDPTVLITDEATSALDSANEKKVQKALDEVMKGRTSIIIAHRLGTIKQAKMIHVIESGTIVESGTHEELIEKRGVFYNLVERQLEKRPE